MLIINDILTVNLIQVYLPFLIEIDNVIQIQIYKKNKFETMLHDTKRATCYLFLQFFCNFIFHIYTYTNTQQIISNYTMKLIKSEKNLYETCYVIFKQIINNLQLEHIKIFKMLADLHEMFQIFVAIFCRKQYMYNELCKSLMAVNNDQISWLNRN